MGLPRFWKVRRRVEQPRLTDIAERTRAELTGAGVHLRPGARVAIAVGSRGIANLSTIVRETAAWVAAQQAVPFIVPAMGSHGGATADGQAGVLAGYGIVEDQVGAAVVSSMEVVEFPSEDLPVPVFYSKTAFEADATVVINRVKPHTSFHGPHESGLLKMIAIGLGKHDQALALHRLGVPGLRDIMPRVARQVLRHGNVVLGIGVVENARDETMLVRAGAAASLVELDQELLEIARSVMPSLPVNSLDIVIVDQMGKDISGLGIDTNVIGRLKIPGQAEPDLPLIRMLVVLDLTAASHGNACGVGLADIITRRLLQKIDFRSTYENVLTSTFLERGKTPMIATDDREALMFASRAAGVPPLSEARILRFKNTLSLEDFWVSESVLPEIRPLLGVELLNPVEEVFDESGQITPL